MRVKAVVSYDGSSFLGFQKQTSTRHTIQQSIEEALHSLHINSGIVASGRTDTGVHATGQVIHFDLPDFWSDLVKLKISLNRKLQQIQFKHISPADENFHARFSAKKRQYRYVFKTSDISVFEQKYISQYAPFDARKLSDALHCFEGEHDFSFFHKTGTVTHTSRREIYKAKYKQWGKYHCIYFQANGFLRSQVRMMVEASMGCAQDELSLHALQEQLNVQTKHTTRLAPPQGLYLAHITY